MGSIPSLVQWIGGSSVAEAVAWIQSLARALPNAVGVAIKKKNYSLKIQAHLREIAGWVLTTEITYPKKASHRFFFGLPVRIKVMPTLPPVIQKH